MAILLLPVMAALATALQAQDAPICLPPAERTAISAALDALNLTPSDPGFNKDLGEPRWALARIRGLLQDPLGLPDLGDEVLRVAATNDPAAEARALRQWLEVAEDALATTNVNSGSRLGTARPGAPSASPSIGQNSPQMEGEPAVSRPLQSDLLDPQLVVALNEFLATARRADALLQQAYAGVTSTDLVAAVAGSLVEAFLVEDHPEVRPALEAIGISGAAVDAVIAEAVSIHPDPSTAHWLATCLAVRLGDVIDAAAEMRQAVARLALGVTNVAWPAQPVRLATPLGDLVVGTLGADRVDAPALLILDPAGDDIYAGEAGSANGLVGRRLAVILDLAGDDRYSAKGMLAPGAAVGGVAVLDDRGGDDVYRAAYVGGAAALYGAAWLEDASGDDLYEAYAFAQGAAFVGVGVLRDGAGRDTYEIGLCGQGYAGVRAIGLLIDASGNDRYQAGGRRTDYDRFVNRYISLAQGYSIGARPFAGGGIGALVDLDGNDAYVADVYGQGCGYWYAAGLLLDRRGEDTYQLFQYGQGSGIHLSLGLLWDGGGDDAYTGLVLCQGNAHDLAVGILLDQGGSDIYTGNHHVQGRAINCAFGLLLDASGDDNYFAIMNDRAQGIGDNGDVRESGSLALLLDLAGTDHYTCGATNGCLLERPDFGVVYDVDCVEKK